jgi:hypothetical protein
MKECPSVARVCQAMGLIMFNELKLEKKFRAYVNRILKAYITPFARFWIGSLRFHDIYIHSNVLRIITIGELKKDLFKANLRFWYFYSRG